MITETELREKVNEKLHEKIEEDKQEELRIQAWKLGICPHCGSNLVEEVQSYWSIWTKFNCKACGNRFKYVTPDKKVK